MPIDIQKIKDSVDSGKIKWTEHVAKRLISRHISHLMKYYRLCPTEGLLKIIHQIILFLAVLFLGVRFKIESCILFAVL